MNAISAIVPAAGQYQPINGVDYYIELHGEGPPLLLLHGGFGTIGMFGPVLAALARSHRVIAVDLYGHGRTALTDRPIEPKAIGDDMAELVARLGFDTVDVMGYSFGGYVAFRMAVQHPARVGRLVLVSMPVSNLGFYPDIVAQQKMIGPATLPMMMKSPLYDAYAAVAPRVEDFPRFVDRMGEAIRTPFDWSAEVGKLTMPVMLIYGDADMIQLDHVVAFYKRLGGGLRDAGWNRETMSRNRLAILPGLTHYDIFRAPALAQAAAQWLDASDG
jgi:pimeloyl-ACP methyl ester carboxylesterase